MIITDTERLDWLTQSQDGLYRVVTKQRKQINTDGSGPSDVSTFEGWSTEYDNNVYDTPREAIDARMKK